MKPLSLLSRYLLATAAVCATAVGATATGLYLAFHSSLEGALMRGTLVYQERKLEGTLNHAHDTTATIADRLGELFIAGNPGEARPLLERAIKLDGAELIVLLDDSGQVLAHAGDLALLPETVHTAPGATVVKGSLVASRQPVVAPGARPATVAQIFNARVTADEVGVFQNLLADMRSQYDRRGLISGVLLAIAVIAAAVLILVGFAFRQVRAIRSLNEGAERMSGGDYDTSIKLGRHDELGQLAATFDQLRERLRTTTISRDQLDKVLSSMSEALLLASRDGRITRANAAACRLLDQRESQLLGRPVNALVAADRLGEFELAETEGRAMETVLVTRDGQDVPVSYTISAVDEGGTGSPGFIITARNIAERKLAEQRIRYLARIDALTKVPNRMQFQHLLQRAIARAGRTNRRLALLYLDVDRFKDINDIYGHGAGDLCLETLTERLRQVLPESTIIGRFAGDEFGIVIEDPAEDNTQIAQAARGILREIAQTIPFQGHQIHMTASIGIAIYPTDAANVIDLVRSADSALYHAKRTGGDTIGFFDPEMNASATERLMLKSRLRRAYERNELLLNYQPKVDLRTGRVAGAEALVRWEMSERGIVLPSEFIPLAEESNLILDIGEWVLDRVCRDLQRWQAQMPVPGKVSVNLSLKQLRQPNFSQRVGNIFRRNGVTAGSLEFEITESTLMENPDRTVRILDELYSMGLSLAIDDFGTGYSSLSALQKFPISTLKIDQSFVRNAATNPDDATIVSTIIQMGHGLNLDVIAEGVESDHQLKFLRTVGCDYVQGLLFGSPMSAGEFMRMLATQQQGAPVFKALFA
jgi:diguanylate cyclase (GGDEF)-like protein/PAS domain S-box-containing protein